MSNVPKPIEDTSFHDREVAEEVKLIAQLRKTPLVLYGIFLELARQFYSDSNNIPIDVTPTWNPEPTQSKIWIDTEYRWEDENPEFRPAIYVKLGDIKYDSLTGRHDGLMRVDLEQGEYHFSRNGTGTVSWIHIGRKKGEAVILAGATLDYLDAFSKVIRDDFCFQTFEVVGMSPMALDKESKERYRSVVTASFSFQDTWALKLESQKLKRVVFNAGQGLVLNGILD
jgi:hypothetical protein